MFDHGGVYRDRIARASLTSCTTDAMDTSAATEINPNRTTAVPVDRSWLLGAWGVPITTAGFGALAIPVALVIGLVAAGPHLGARG